jgi:hypothetical protein
MEHEISKEQKWADKCSHEVRALASTLSQVSEFLRQFNSNVNQTSEVLSGWNAWVWDATDATDAWLVRTGESGLLGCKKKRGKKDGKGRHGVVHGDDDDEESPQSLLPIDRHTFSSARKVRKRTGMFEEETD